MFNCKQKEIDKLTEDLRLSKNQVRLLTDKKIGDIADMQERIDSMASLVMTKLSSVLTLAEDELKTTDRYLEYKDNKRVTVHGVAIGTCEICHKAIYQEFDNERDAKIFAAIASLLNYNDQTVTHKRCEEAIGISRISKGGSNHEAN